MKKYYLSQLKSLPLQWLLIVPFVLLISATVGLVGFLSFKNGQKAVNALADQLIEGTGNTVEQHLNTYLSTPHKVSQLNASAIQMGLLDIRDRQTMGRYFWQQMQAYDVSYIGVGLSSGEGVGAARYDGKTTTLDDWGAKPPNNWYSYALDAQGNRTKVLQILDWNSFEQVWYTGPIKAGKPVWSSIYTIDYPNEVYIAISAGRPIYNTKQQLVGMVSTDLSLLAISNFLRQPEVRGNGQVFLLERDGRLLASSDPEQFYVRVKGQIQRLKATDSPNPVIRGVAQQLNQQFNNLQSLLTPQELQLQVQGESQYVRVIPWRDRYGLDWLVVLTVPEHAFMAQIHANNRLTIGLCLVALAIASIIAIWATHWITRPILRLSQASQAIAAGDLNQAIEDSHIQELNTLASSFNYMAGQLRASFSALERNNEELEDRVEQRTQELTHALNELQRTQTQVIQGEKMSSLGQLVAGVAHEINNPVNFIYGNLNHVQAYTQDLLNFVQLYERHYPEPIAEIQDEAARIDLEFLQADLPKIVSSMKMGTDRIRQIVLSLRNFSRMDESEVKAVDIHEGLDSTLLILQHRLKEQVDRPEIQVVKDYGYLPRICCYAGQLNQVFMNILTNAIDALEEKFQLSPMITLRTSMMDEDWAQIVIADNGPGMPEMIQRRIFDPFFTTKPVGKGTGMGMSISYQIVTEKHGGQLDCLSIPERGTEFIIQIPINPSERLG